MAGRSRNDDTSAVIPTYTASLLDSDDDDGDEPVRARRTRAALEPLAAKRRGGSSAKQCHRGGRAVAPYRRARRVSTALRESVDALVQQALLLQDRRDYEGARLVINKIDALQRQAAEAARQQQPRSRRPQRASLVLDNVHATRMAKAVRKMSNEDRDALDDAVVKELEELEEIEEEETEEGAIQETARGEDYSQLDSCAVTTSTERSTDLELSGSDVLLLVAPPIKEGVLRTLHKTPQQQSKTDSTPPLPPPTAQGSFPGGGTVPPPSPSSASVSYASERAMVSKEGMMFKSPPLLRTFARWHKRWFVLSGRLLVYCKHERSKVPKGMIELTGATIKAVNSKSGPTEWEVRVHVVAPEQRTFRLAVGTKEECIAWYTAIENNIICATEARDQASATISRIPSSSEDASCSEERRRSRVGIDVGAPPPKPPRPSHYEVLGISSTSTPAMVKKAYYRLAREFHPDKNPDADPAAFADINRAFQCLKEQELRSDYDLSERVKAAMRIGVLVLARGEDSTLDGGPKALFMDHAFDYLFLQAPELGMVLGEEYYQIEMRWVQAVAAGGSSNENLTITIVGEKLPHGPVELEFDTPASRDEMLDGLRVMRTERSMLFAQKLDEMREKGMR